jgi:hypothetical protein
MEGSKKLMKETWNHISAPESIIVDGHIYHTNKAVLDNMPANEVHELAMRRMKQLKASKEMALTKNVLHTAVPTFTTTPADSLSITAAVSGATASPTETRGWRGMGDG